MGIESRGEDLAVRGGRKRIPLPAEQGVYDPIKNVWLVAPENKQICVGLAFAPVPKQHFR